MKNLNSSSQDPHTTLRDIIFGYRLTQLIYVMAELRIADLLKDGPKTSDELAAATRTHPASLFRVLRALASVGIFERVDTQTFALNPLAEPLTSDSSNSLRPSAMLTGTQLYPAWGNILHTVKTGETAFDALFGTNDWDYRANNPAAGAIFNAAMSVTGNWQLDQIAAQVDWSQFGTIVDVGGGQGTLLVSILKRAPHARGILFDMAGPVAAAGNVFEQAGLAARTERIAGSFLQSVPSGGDAYILSRILHDWHDQAAALILRNCRRAIEPGKHLFLFERLLDATHPSPDVTFTDLNMMVMNGGRERTANEFGELLTASGFALDRVIATSMPAQILVGVAV